jgi:hypothetical protein
MSRLSFKFDTRRFDHFLRELEADVRERIAKPAILDVAENHALPTVAKRTPFGHGSVHARTRWKLGRSDFRRARPFVEIMNPLFYARFLEHGTVKMRGTGMLKTTFRDLKAKNLIPRKLRTQLVKRARKAKRKAEAIRV